MINIKAKKYILSIAVILAGLIIGFLSWLIYLDQQIQARLAEGWFRPPVELYAAPETILLRQQLKPETLVDWLKSWHYRERFEGDTIMPGDFAQLTINDCADATGSPFMGDTDNCIIVHTPPGKWGAHRESNFHIVAFNTNGLVTKLYSGKPLAEVMRVQLPPELFAQFYDGVPILRKMVTLGEVPVACLQSVTAVEDSQFLEHVGVSFTGIFRAAIRNVLAGRYAQGGSTITQQLVKNYFLTAERSIKRKVVEAIMAMLLELRSGKDDILQTYLNVIYMGQNGPFQVIGFGSASDFYLRKNISDLNLSDCALLAAIINNPGRYNPYSKSENAKKRRDFVLKRMVEVNSISEEEAAAAMTAPLPTKKQERLTEPAPYFTQAVFREIKSLEIDSADGLRIFTTLNERAQESAQVATKNHVEKLETNFKSLADKKLSGKTLEGSIIVVDVESGGVQALVGGRQYKSTQFNRVLDAHRQVGSVMKPFVFLAALEGQNKNGETYTPLSVVDDSPFTHKYEGQTWSPQNYDNKYMGPVPFYVALKNSLNCATIKVGLDVGISNIIDVAKRAGVESKMEPFPSLTLGAFEIQPWEIAESYSTFARMGVRKKIFTISSVESLSGDVIYQHAESKESQFTPEVVAGLVSMLKQTFVSGSARSAANKGFRHPAAGKTGTTSDTRDTWFAGFTPYLLAVTWVGYDDNTPTGLTGVSGALPLWVEFMRGYGSEYPDDDFKWPSEYQRTNLSTEEILKLCPKCEPYETAPTEI